MFYDKLEIQTDYFFEMKLDLNLFSRLGSCEIKRGASDQKFGFRIWIRPQKS